MYNRYIPQSDGTYQRRRMQDQSARPPAPPVQFTPPPQQQTAPQANPLPCPPPEPPRRPMPQPRMRPRPCREPENNNSVTGFLKQLLPKDFDTGDLIVVLLLLLMSGDCQEDQNTALLTLALYLFM